MMMMMHTPIQRQRSNRVVFLGLYRIHKGVQPPERPVVHVILDYVNDI